MAWEGIVVDVEARGIGLRDSKAPRNRSARFQDSAEFQP